jgi:hypothetical protein
VLVRSELEQAADVAVQQFFCVAYLASAYPLRGETERAAAELAEARRLRGEDSFLSIAKATGVCRTSKIRSLCETTYFAGLRKAGVPEE